MSTFGDSMTPSRPSLTVAVLGHVDTGKSTLVGHLTFLCGCFGQRMLDKLERESAEMGKASFKYAWVCDKSKDERERGITISLTETHMFTSKYSITVVDTPGHRNFTKTTVLGTSFADCAILVVAATQDEYEASMANDGLTKELALIAFAQGIKQLVVVVNKMDALSTPYEEARFNEIKTEVGEHLAKLGFQDDKVQYVPVAAWDGENLTTKSTRMPWYDGLPLLELLDQFTVPRRSDDKPLRVPIQAVYKIGGVGTVAVGRVETGVLRPGTKVKIGPRNIDATVFSVEAHHMQLAEAHPGTNVGINLKGVAPSDIERGFMLSDPNHDPARRTVEFTAQIVILEHPGQIMASFSPIVHCHSLQVACRFKQILCKLDRQTGEVLEKNPESVVEGDACLVVLEPEKATVFEAFREYPSMGRILLRDGNRTIAVGVIRSVVKSGDAQPRLP